MRNIQARGAPQLSAGVILLLTVRHWAQWATQHWCQASLTPLDNGHPVKPFKINYLPLLICLGIQMYWHNYLFCSVVLTGLVLRSYCSVLCLSSNNLVNVWTCLKYVLSLTQVFPGIGVFCKSINRFHASFVATLNYSYSRVESHKPHFMDLDLFVDVIYFSIAADPSLIPPSVCLLFCSPN